MINTREFTELTQKRCDLAENESIDFKILEERFCQACKNEDLEEIIDLLLQLRCLAAELGYKKGFTDALSLVANPCSQIV